MQQEMHSREGEDSCRDIIEHDSGAVAKTLQLPHRRGLHDIERSEKYKAREESFPCEWHGDQSDQLSSDLVDDDELWIFSSRRVRYSRGGRDADQRDQHCEADGDWSMQGGREFMCDQGPQDDCDG
jgi:hypothetical protein